MNSNLFFLLIACVSVSFTIIVICNGPVINGILDIEPYENCKILHDQYDEVKSGLSKEQKKPYLRGIHKCERDKAIYGLEYASLIMDIFFGFVCALLGLLNYFGAAKSFEKIIGLIGLISGVICFIMTLVYICYSGYIFNNDSSGKVKRDKDGIFAELNNDDYYNCKYPTNDDENAAFAKYSDLGKKQYNYNKDNYFADLTAEVSGCTISEEQLSNVANFCSSSSLLSQLSYVETGSFSIPKTYGVSSKCKNLYFTLKITSISNKYNYDKWVTSIIFGIFVIACNIGLALFGFLIFKDGGSNGHTPIN